MTVGELIEKLSAFDPTLPVVIDDADTHWSLDIKTVVFDASELNVQIGGGYY